MLLAKFRDHRISGVAEEDFSMFFIIYGCGGNLGACDLDHLLAMRFPSRSLKMMGNVDGRRRSPEHGGPISSPC